MKHLKQIAIVALMCMSQITLAQTKQNVDTFNKVIISPHIETTFVQGSEESVTILKNTLSDDKVNIEVKGETLRVYLDDAKETTKQRKIKKNGTKIKVPLYEGKVLTILVTYRNIDDLSLRGNQRTVCKSLIKEDTLKLKIYGESQTTFNEIAIEELDVNVYGESQLTILKGTTKNQNITAYGEGKINIVEVANRMSKLKAYGEAEFTVSASDQIKFTAYGEAELHYKGNAIVSSGLSFGDATIQCID